MINRFLDEYRFLSNFFECAVVYNGMSFRSAECAYQAAKCADPREQRRFQWLTSVEAKVRGRQLQMRSDWNRVRVQVMHDIVRAKFEQNPDLRQKLLSTGSEELIEGNTWGDTFWGVCKGSGQNWLGRILMFVRDEVREASIVQ